MKIEKSWCYTILLAATSLFTLAALPAAAQITMQSGDQSVNTGGTATYAVVDAAGTNFQWQLDGVNISDGVDANGSTYSGSATPTLTITRVTPQDAVLASAGFACVVQDGVVNPTSTPAALVVRLVRFPFDGANTGSNYLSASDPDSGVSASLLLLNGSGVPTDYHGQPNSGVNGFGRAFDLSSNLTQPDGTTTGPVATATNAPALGFNTLSAFTLTEWFMIQPGATTLNAGRNPRLWVVGPGGTQDSTVTGALGLKLGDGGADLNGCKANFNNTDLNNANGSYVYYSATAAQASYWYFIALTYDGSTLTYYSGDTNDVSAAFATDTIAATFPIGTNGAVLIGNRTSDFLRSFAGFIDDARFFSGVGAGIVENARLLGITPGPVLVTTATNDTQVALSWTTFGPAGLTGSVTYNVKRASVSGGPYTLLTAGTGLSGTSFTDTTALAGRNYYYVVAPFTSAGEGNLSAEAPATTTGVASGVVLTATRNAGGSLTLSLTGTPGAQYHAQVTASIAGVPVWVNLPGSTNLAASPGGAWTFTDTNTASFTPRFYQAVSP